jgi:hypothetical protein
MKRHKHGREYSIKTNIQIFDGIDWTELADDGVKFGGHEYKFEFSTSVYNGKSLV